MKGLDITKFIISLLICQGAGFAGSLFTRMSVATWYQTLQKPSFAPPNWAFAPAWITIFTLMAISLFLVIKREGAFAADKKAIYIFTAQLIFNIAWSAAFFGLRSPAAGLAIILILWFLILLNIIEFYKISASAGILLIPYILWVSFASCLNFEYWRLNG